MLGELESNRFVGREADLERLRRALEREGEPAVAFVHGPGGIGKSALLRELGRRASAAGLRIQRADGRDPDAAWATVELVLERPEQSAGTLLLIDTYERALALGGLLRARLEPALRAGCRVVIAGRRPPEPAWLEDGWQEALVPIGLEPLPDRAAEQLLAARGLADPGARRRLVAWAAGSPLALGVGADSILAGNTLDLDRLDADALLASTLVARLAGAELEGADHNIVAVAAIARAVDSQLLAAALPGVDGDHAEAWLRGLSFAERLGTRVTLHERVRRSVRATLRAAEPEHERELRRRLVDHLYGRATMGELRLLVDIADLIEDPRIRWGVAPPPTDVRADRLRPGDRERLETMLGAAGKRWWRGARRWLEEAPEHVIVVRDAAGAVVGWRIWATPASAPEWVGEDAILGPWLADARRRDPDGDVLLLRDGSDLVRERDAAPTSPVVSAANYASVLGSGLRSVRYMYATTDPEDRQVHEFLLAMGYERVPELDVVDCERTVRCYVVDWGPGGVVRAVRDLVYYGIGMKPPAPSPATEPRAELVRDALRSFHDPVALAASPLARGQGIAARAASVREQLAAATASAFGDSPEQRLLRATIERGYLDPEGGHVRAMQELSVSRTTYFRRLAEASEQLASTLLASRP